MLWRTVVLEKILESPLDCKEIQPVHPKGNQSWVFIGRTDVEAETVYTLATWCKELTHLKRPWCWERLRAGRERDNRGWDGWMASPTQWTWVWVNSGSLLKLMSVELVMPSNHLILCCPLLLLPSIFPSIRVFSSVSVLSSHGQSIGASAPELVFPMNILDWYPLGLTGLISLQSKGLSRVLSSTTILKHHFCAQPSLWKVLFSWG